MWRKFVDGILKFQTKGMPDALRNAADINPKTIALAHQSLWMAIHSVSLEGHHLQDPKIAIIFFLEEWIEHFLVD